MLFPQVCVNAHDDRKVQATKSPCYHKGFLSLVKAITAKLDA